MPDLFDPARDGFGFRNPAGLMPDRNGGGALLRRLDAFLYGSGLCFGMAAAALDNHIRPTSPYPLASLSLTPEVLGIIQDYHSRQLRPRCVLAAAGDWLRARGGRPEGLLERLRLLGASPDPHLVNFGPAVNEGFLRCFYRAHAVVPYRADEEGGETRLYVYDPNYPKDRSRYVSFRGGGFEYGTYSSRDGWGITLAPLSAIVGNVPAAPAIGDTARPL